MNCSPVETPWASVVEQKTEMRGGSVHGSTSKPKPRAPVPKEHGAWFMLGHCLLIGAMVSGSLDFPVLLVILASVLVFLATQGLKTLARSLRNREHGSPIRFPRTSLGFLLGAAVAGLAAAIGWDLDVLWVWGAISLVLTAVYILVLLRKKERSVLGEWWGILGLTQAAGVVWSAGTGNLGLEAVALWALAFLYFGGSVPYVKLRVRQMKSDVQSHAGRMRDARAALVVNSLTLFGVGLAAALGRLPALVIAPFVLSAIKVLWVSIRGRGPKTIARVGYSEAVLSTVFALLVILAYWPQQGVR